jgi:transposase
MGSRKSQYELARLVRDIRDRDNGLTDKKFKYKPREPKKRDWFWYTEAQVNEMNDYLVLIKNMVDAARERLDYIEGRESNPGQQPKSPFDLAKAVLLQQYFQASNRVAAGLSLAFKEKLGIEKVLTYKDIERAYSNQDVMTILDEIVKMSNEPVKDSETRFSIDGTGVENSVRQNYASDKEEDAKGAGYDMLVGMVGYEYKMFSAFGIGGPGEESPFLIPLLGRTHRMFSRIDMVSADPAYLSRDNCDYIESIGAKPGIFPKKNSKINSGGSYAWMRMILGFVSDAQSWLEDYHQRSISESTNSSFKCRAPRPLLKKRKDRRHGEIGARVSAYNIRRLGYIRYTHQVSVPWLTN